jgi:hypothetical protein
LKTFEWTGSNRGFSIANPFGSFRGFTQLEELTLGCQFLTYWRFEPPEHLLHPETFLPESLVTLTIMDFPEMLLHGLQKPTIFSPSENYILSTATSLGLSKFDLFATWDLWWLGTGYMKGMREFLTELVSSLNDVGTSMRIYQQEGESDSDSTLLFELGCTAERPQ